MNVNTKTVSLFILLLIGGIDTTLFSQNNNEEPEALGLPGDNLNLYAVLEIFQNSKTLEAFEKSINDKETNINNLDLDNDRNIDYINIDSYEENESYLIILNVYINETENQDIAIIEVNTDSNNEVRVQIIGDEDLYGENYIIEPSGVDTDLGTPNPGYINKSPEGNNNMANYEDESSLSVANNWPVIIYMYSPRYMNYRSPWYWGHYPSYWNPWVPMYYYNYWTYHNHYYRNHYYRRTNHILYPSRYNNYSNRRNSSSVVKKNLRDGNYKATYNGRDYKKPASPSRPATKPTTPSTRPTTPTTRPTTPSTRPVVTKPTTPATRPVTKPTVPTTRPTTPSTRPVTKPTVPTTRPVTKPTVPTTRTKTPSTSPVTKPVTTPSKTRATRI